MEMIKSLKIETLNNIGFKLEYDYINTYMVYNMINNENLNNLVLIHPTGKSIISILSTILAVGLYKYNLENSNYDLKDKLSPGDFVKVDGCLSKFKGFMERDFNYLDNQSVYCIIEFANNDTTYFPEKKWWKIKKYDGNATRLEKHKKRDDDSYLAEDILAEIFEIDKKDILKFEKNQLLLVDDKNFLMDEFKNIKVNDIEFSRLFPSGYYKNKNEFERLPGDPYQRKPFINFTSNLYIAEELIMNNKNINTIIINGYNKIQGYYSTILNLLESSKVKNIIVLMDPKNKDKYYDLKNLGFKSWIWTEKDVKEIHKKENILEHRNTCYYYKSIKNMFFRSKELIDVKLPDECNILRRDVLNLLENLKNESVESAYINKYFKFAYGLLLHLQTMPFPLENNVIQISELALNINLNPDIMIERMENLIDKIIGTSLGNEYKSKLQEVVIKLDKYKFYFKTENLKLNKIYKSIKNKDKNESIVILVRRTGYISILKDILKEKGLLKDEISILTFKNINKEINYDKIIITCWPGYKKVKPLFYKGIADKIIFLLYNFEIDDYYLNAINSIESQIERDRSIKERIEIPILSELINKDNGEDDTLNKLDLVDNINKIITSFNDYSLPVDYTTSTDNKNEKIKAYPVIFENGEFLAFLTENYSARLLERNEEKILKRNIKDLRDGDEIIFTRDSKDDIFTALNNELEEKDNEIHEMRELAGRWRETLIELNNSEYSLEFIKTLLEEKGFNYNIMTIKNWINSDDIIGPREYDVIDAIAEIADDKKLKMKSKEIKRAISRIRSIHNKLGRYLAKSIVRSVVDDNKENEINQFLKESNISSDYSRYAVVVEITEIYDKPKSVDRSKTNILIENY
jgi:hypothetical protein